MSTELKYIIVFVLLVFIWQMFRTFYSAAGRNGYNSFDDDDYGDSDLFDDGDGGDD